VHALEDMSLDTGFHPSEIRASDHRLIQPLYVMEMDRAGTPGVHFDNEGSASNFVRS
jgi:branched-chain amino acid transport system substrate-binding protein